MSFFFKKFAVTLLFLTLLYSPLSSALNPQPDPPSTGQESLIKLTPEQKKAKRLENRTQRQLKRKERIKQRKLKRIQKMKQRQMKRLEKLERREEKIKKGHR